MAYLKGDSTPIRREEKRRKAAASIKKKMQERLTQQKKSYVIESYSCDESPKLGSTFDKPFPRG